MKRDLPRLSSNSFDLIVVGGGIYGACAAWEALLRGLSVALIEQADFGGATSSNMHRIAHGGFRYLQNADLKRMRESIRERKALIRIAPHLVHPLPFLIPTQNKGLERRSIMHLALKAYEVIAFDCNRDISDPSRRIPPGRIISREECLRLAPSLNPEGITGGAVWYDGKIENPDRLTLEFVRSGVESGVCAANYARVTELLHNKGRVFGVRVVDRLTQDKFEVRGKMVLNSTGPWTDRLLEPFRPLRSTRRVRLARSINIITSPLTNEGHGVTANVPHRGIHDGVHDGCCLRYFSVPWFGHAIVGSLDVLEETNPDRVLVKSHELEGLVDRANAAFPNAGLSYDDVSRVHVGLLPLADSGPKNDPYNAARHYTITDHHRTHGIHGLLSVVGVKYTTARDVAQKTISLVLKQLDLPETPSRSANTPLHGGHIENFPNLLQDAIARRPDGLSETTMRQLVRNYGSDYQSVTRHIKDDARLAEPVHAESGIIKAQVVHAARHEMAQKLVDVVCRRTELGIVRHPGHDALKICAEVMATEMGWTDDRIQRELDETRAEFERVWAQPPVHANN